MCWRRSIVHLPCFVNVFNDKSNLWGGEVGQLARDDQESERSLRIFYTILDSLQCQQVSGVWCVNFMHPRNLVSSSIKCRAIHFDKFPGQSVAPAKFTNKHLTVSQRQLKCNSGLFDLTDTQLSVITSAETGHHRLPGSASTFWEDEWTAGWGKKLFSQPTAQYQSSIHKVKLIPSDQYKGIRMYNNTESNMT